MHTLYPPPSHTPRPTTTPHLAQSPIPSSVQCYQALPHLTLPLLLPHCIRRSSVHIRLTNFACLLRFIVLECCYLLMGGRADLISNKCPTKNQCDDMQTHFCRKQIQLSLAFMLRVRDVLQLILMSDKSDQHSDHESSHENCKVYISNINKTIEEDDIRRKFSEFGVIKSLILKKKENNVTYSFIEYDKPSQAQAAIAEMDKKTYFDRILKVEHGKGGNRGLEHYHTNRYDKLRGHSNGRGYDDYKKRSRDRYSSYSSRDSYDRRHDRSPRRHDNRDRREYKYDEKYERRRSRSFEGRDRRDREKDYYRRDSFKDRRDYERDDRDRYYDDRRYRDRDDKYGRDYQKDRKDDRRDYGKYDKYEKERHRDYERSPRPTKYEEKEGERYNKDERFAPKEPERYQKENDRYQKDGDRFQKEGDRYVKDDRYKDDRYAPKDDRYADRYLKDDRYDKYRGANDDYKRPNYDRRKEYTRDEVSEPNKDFQQLYQPRTNGGSYDKPRPVEPYSRPEQR